MTNILKRLALKLRASNRDGSKHGPFNRGMFDLILTMSKTKTHIQNQSDPYIRAFLSFCFENALQFRSQLFQDAFVLWILDKKQSGFFVEFGATNGIDLSNSYSLEKNYGWTGICAEPAKGWHEALRRNRPGAIIETECVWERSGEHLDFSETPRTELSGLTEFATDDRHASKRLGALRYNVRTISLSDMLEKYKAPAVFDYLSIDTEGSEFRILQAHDFDRFRPRVITVEHNFTEKREQLLLLLSSKGYKRVLPEVSAVDDWYLSEEMSMPEPADRGTR